MPKKEVEVMFTGTWTETFEAHSVEEAEEKIEQYFRDVNSGKQKLDTSFMNLEVDTDSFELDEYFPEGEWDGKGTMQFIEDKKVKKTRRFS